MKIILVALFMLDDKQIVVSRKYYVCNMADPYFQGVVVNIFKDFKKIMNKLNFIRMTM